MGYTENDVFIGTGYSAGDLMGGFRFTLDIPQGSTIDRAFLKFYVEQMYPGGQGAYDLFVDSNDTGVLNHTMDLGPAWVRAGAGSGYYDASDAVTIQSNAAEGRSVNTEWAHHRYMFVGTSPDGVLQAKVNYQTAFANARTGLLFRHLRSSGQHPSAWYWVFWAEVVSGSHANYYVSKVYEYWVQVWDDDLEDWVWIVIYSFTTVASNLNDSWSDWPTFKVVLDGASIKCYVNDSLMFDLYSGYLVDRCEHGLYGYPVGLAETGYFQWDNFDFVPAGTPTPNLVAACDDVDDSDDFSASLPGTRTLTTARVSLGDISGWAAGWNRTADISEAIQEVINRGGWSSGNALSVILYPAEANSAGEVVRATSYDGSAALGAQLYVNYS